MENEIQDENKNDSLMSDKTDSDSNHLNHRYRCEYSGCKRTYSTIGNLRTHMKTHKGKIKLIYFKSINTLIFYASRIIKKW